MILLGGADDWRGREAAPFDGRGDRRRGQRAGGGRPIDPRGLAGPTGGGGVGGPGGTVCCPGRPRFGSNTVAAVIPGSGGTFRDRRRCGQRGTRRGDHLTAAREAVGRVLGQRLRTDVAQGARQVRPKLMSGGGGSWTCRYSSDGVLAALNGGRPPSVSYISTPERVQVGPLVDQVAARLLGRHVLRACRSPSGSPSGGSASPARAIPKSVSVSDVARLDHDVGRLDIAVEDRCASGRNPARRRPAPASPRARVGRSGPSRRSNCPRFSPSMKRIAM